MSVEFEPWPKIPRYGKGSVIVTEKLDGTNAQINIVPYPKNLSYIEVAAIASTCVAVVNGFIVYAGSRKRYITPEDDNYGFASWVYDNVDDIIKLGEGRHFGEWYGAGIQRRYGLNDKRFALFNTQRWGPHNPNTPECCEAVPILYQGDWTANVVDECMRDLKSYGSIAVSGFMQPEGIITYNTATRLLTKSTFESPNGKWEDK